MAIKWWLQINQAYLIGSCFPNLQTSIKVKADITSFYSITLIITVTKAFFIWKQGGIKIPCHDYLWIIILQSITTLCTTDYYLKAQHITVFFLISITQILCTRVELLLQMATHTTILLSLLTFLYLWHLRKLHCLVIGSWNFFFLASARQSQQWITINKAAIGDSRIWPKC